MVLLPAGLSPDLVVLALLAGLAGVLVSPALATACVLVAALAPPRARNRAGNWVSSGYNAGSTAGSALSGQLIGRIPLAACLPVLLAVVPLPRAAAAQDQRAVSGARRARPALKGTAPFRSEENWSLPNGRGRLCCPRRPAVSRS